MIFTVEVNERLVGKRFCGRIIIGKGRIRFFRVVGIISDEKLLRPLKSSRVA